VVADDGRGETLPLPIGGLMSDQGPEFISKALKRLKGLAREVGCKLDEPFLQLSFLALPVIPKLKVTDQGLIAEQEGRLAIVPVVKELI